jgi:tetratricopeptide (TPR) repeat protein
MPSLDEARRRHAKHYLQVTQRDRENFNSLGLEMPNIALAVNFYEEVRNWQQLAKLIDGLNDYWLRRALWNQYLKFNSMLLQANAFERIDERVKILNHLTEFEQTRGNYNEARQLYEETIKILRRQESEQMDLVIDALRQLPGFAKAQDNDNEAMAYLQEGLAIARQYELPKEEADILFEMAVLYRRIGKLEHAYRICETCLGIATSLGYFSSITDILILQASIRSDESRFMDAFDLYQSGLDNALKYGDKIRAIKIREKLVYAGAMIGKQIFVSYNRQDRDFAEQLAKDLKSAGIAVWWAEWEINVGDSIVKKVNEGIDRSAYLAVVLSPSSVTSDWVQTELNSALMIKLSGKKDITILPLLRADCDIPVLLQQYKWADFRQDYQTGFQEILKLFKPSGTLQRRPV